MSVTTAQLLALAKEAADLTNVTDYVTDSTWVSWLNAAVVELHRFVTNKFKATYIRTYDFTFAAGTSQLTLPTDFWRLRGLDIDPGTPRRREVRPYNFAERNRYNRSSMRDLDPAIFVRDRAYNVIGSSLLKIEAEENAAGNYRLYYVPKPGTLALPITVDFAIDAGDVPFVPSSPDPGNWLLANAAFPTDGSVPEDGSAELTLTFDAPNTGFNGTYFITDVVSESNVLCSNLTSSVGFSSPAGGTGSYTYQAVGTVNELDAELEPFAEYVWLTAAIKSLMKEESFAQAKALSEQRNLIRQDLEEALEPDQGGPSTIIDTDDWGDGG